MYMSKLLGAAIRCSTWGMLEKWRYSFTSNKAIGYTLLHYWLYPYTLLTVA